MLGPGSKVTYKSLIFISSVYCEITIAHEHQIDIKILLALYAVSKFFLTRSRVSCYPVPFAAYFFKPPVFK